MTKSELKTGMIVVLANGTEYMVYKGIQVSFGNVDSALVATDGRDCWLDLDNYNENLTAKREYKDLDIVKVIEVSHPYAFIRPNYDSKRRKVLWSRKKQYTYAQLREILGEEFEVVG